MKLQEPQTVLITGASSGIGSSFAQLFAQQGYQLILASRSENKLNELSQSLHERYQTKSIVIPVDLAKPDGPPILYERVKSYTGTLDVLINNAGVGSYGFLHEQNITAELEMLQLNIQSVTHLMMLVLPDMIRRRSGRILNLGSTTSFYPCPLSANYSASKSYVLSLTEAVANELSGTGVSVTALCPGGTGTSFFRTAGMDKQKVASTASLMSPEKVAQAGYDALMKGTTVVVPGKQNWLLTQAPRLFPRKMITRITRGVLEQTL
ncbi:SDR family NAD(P)-dependent oxidoreductase [Paenibacillus kobensis]|uniref:SDR family NAD(P)-dependent oxidoreductase n=1 Tax=Paenibacillus kobensis TaxID=59841 RepID=UPI000FDBA7B6|nr:SDR family oxidoreductase [Paenibacillus kobensis]